MKKSKDINTARKDYFNHFNEMYMIVVPSALSDEEVIEDIYKCIETDQPQDLEFKGDPNIDY